MTILNCCPFRIYKKLAIKVSLQATHSMTTFLFVLLFYQDRIEIKVRGSLKHLTSHKAKTHKVFS